MSYSKAKQDIVKALFEFAKINPDISLNLISKIEGENSSMSILENEYINANGTAPDLLDNLFAKIALNNRFLYSLEFLKQGKFAGRIIFYDDEEPLQKKALKDGRIIRLFDIIHKILEDNHIIKPTNSVGMETEPAQPVDWKQPDVLKDEKSAAEYEIRRKNIHLLIIDFIKQSPNLSNFTLSISLGEPESRHVEVVVIPAKDSPDALLKLLQNYHPSKGYWPIYDFNIYFPGEMYYQEAHIKYENGAFQVERGTTLDNENFAQVNQLFNKLNRILTEPVVIDPVVTPKPEKQENPDVVTKEQFQQILYTYKSSSFLGFLSTFAIFFWIPKSRSQTMKDLQSLLAATKNKEITKAEVEEVINRGSSADHRYKLFKGETTTPTTGTDKVILKLKDAFKGPGNI